MTTPHLARPSRPQAVQGAIQTARKIKNGQKCSLWLNRHDALLEFICLIPAPHQPGRARPDIGGRDDVPSGKARPTCFSKRGGPTESRDAP